MLIVQFRMSAPVTWWPERTYRGVCAAAISTRRCQPMCQVVTEGWNPRMPGMTAELADLIHRYLAITPEIEHWAWTRGKTETLFVH